MMRNIVVLTSILHFTVASVIPRQDDQWQNDFNAWKSEKKPNAAIAEAFQNHKGVDLNEYTKPNEPIEQFLAVGDSYTAGIGSDGPGELHGDSKAGECSRYQRAWPEQIRGERDLNDRNAGIPKLTFGACSGGLMKDVRDKQLELGDPKDEDQYKKIGTPQLAVMTISGNDASFADIVNDCIYKWWGPASGDCGKTLEKVSAYLDDPLFKQNLQLTWADVIAAGRVAKGANPANSFQLYVGGYVKFFNDQDSVCDDVHWNLWGSRIYLTRDHRKKLNDLVDKLNDLIRDAAQDEGMKKYGVIYVEGYAEQFEGHKFCDRIEGWTDDELKKYHQDQWDNGAITAFWSWYSNWQDGYEGPGYVANQSPQSDPAWKEAPFNKTKLLLEALIPDEGTRNKVSEDHPPEEVSDAFKNRENFEKALNDLRSSDNPAHVMLTDDYRRIFHPKGGGYVPWSSAFKNAIIAERNWDWRGQPSQKCSFHLEHYEKCPESKKLEEGIFGLIDVKGPDNNTLEMSYEDGTKVTPKDEIKLWTSNDDNADIVKLKSSLSHELWLDPLWVYAVTFSYDGNDWKTTDNDGANGKPYCEKSDDWSPGLTDSSIPADFCNTHDVGTEMRRRKYDCFFSC